MAPIWKSVDRKRAPWDKKGSGHPGQRDIKVLPTWTQPGPRGQGSGRDGKHQRECRTAGHGDSVSFLPAWQTLWWVLSLIWTTQYLLVRKGSFVSWKASSLTAPPSLAVRLHLLPQLHPFASLQVHTSQCASCPDNWPGMPFHTCF